MRIFSMSLRVCRRSLTITRVWGTALLGLFLAMTARGVPPVEFTFELSPAGPEPFARDLWAEVTLPDGTSRGYPAFFDGGETWRVRVAARSEGIYRLGAVTERDPAGPSVARAPRVVGPFEVARSGTLSGSVIRVDPSTGRGFVRDGEVRYFPFGLNLSWGDLAFYRRAFAQCEAAGMNWTRIWMAHWAGANLDWLPAGQGASPRPGTIDVGVAGRWDEVLSLAENAGVFVQVVLHHHGQYSTEVNPEWSRHPWNVVNGGFLAKATDFFTSEEARRHTRTKLRYIAARYGHSPAVLAWELFNEVNFTDAWKREKQLPEIARWHDEMAAWLRRNDPHGHLVTTSTSEPPPVGPLWRSMDYYQPHLYHVNMLAHIRRFPEVVFPTDKPLFYGEVGDDHMAYAHPEDKASGAGLVPQIWLGLMADHALPAQAWYWDRLLDTPRWGELTAVARFIAAVRLPERAEGLRAFVPRVLTSTRMAHRIGPGYHWATREPLELTVADDGREWVALADVPDFFVGQPQLVEEGRADRLTLKLDRDRTGTLQVRLADVGPRGLTLELTINGETALSRSWPEEPDRKAGELRPAELALSLPSGRSVVTLRNLGPDSFRLRELDLDATIPVLAAVGKRDASGAFLYVWNRQTIHSAGNGAPVEGVVELEDLPAGSWTSTWWNMSAGRADDTRDFEHPGGTLHLTTPAIGRHAAVYLERRNTVELRRERARAAW